MNAYTDDPQTRVEAILQNILGKNNLLQPPQTRVEELLLLIYEQGGGGGTEPVIKYKGVTTTPLTDGSTTNPVEIDGEEVTAETGDFVAYNGAEFIWNGTAWQELGDLELVAAIMTSIAPTYSESETYNIGDKVYYNDILYKCLDNNVTGSFTPAKWEQISVAQILSELESDVDSIFDTISDTYDPSTTYNEGNLVIHNKKLYKCNTDGTTGAWNSAKWDETTIAYELENATPVEANPVEDATAELNKLKIFDDVYSVGNAHFMPISQEDYDDLTDEEIHNGTIYFIYDAPALEVTANPDDDPEEPLVKLSIDGVIYYVPAELPEVTPEDNGKILKVVDGAWVAATEIDPTSIIDDTDTDTDTVWSSSKTDSEIIRTLSGLSDTEITSPTDKQILRYDNTNSKWVNSDEASVTKTATGSVIEITDASAAPMVKCVTEITGSQDLHGYDKPWVGGAGKNKLPMTVSGIKSANTSGTWSGNVYALNGVTFTIETDGDDNITGIKVNNSTVPTGITYLDLVGTFDSTTYAGMIFSGLPSTTPTGLTIRASANNRVSLQEFYPGDTPIVDNGNGLKLAIRLSTTVIANNVEILPMIRLSTVTDSTFAPYSNICPITAYTEGEIEVRGKNLWDESETTSNEFSNNNGVYTNTNTDTKTDFTLRVQALKNNVVVRTPISGTVYTTTGYKSTTFTITDGTDYDTLRIKHNGSSRDLIIDYPFNEQGTFALSFDLDGCNSSVVGGLVIKNIQLEKGSTATTYEPYTSTTHTTTYPSAIYRGSEDCVEGEVTAEWGMIEFDGSNDENWGYNENNALAYINIPNGVITNNVTQHHIFTKNNLFADASWSGRSSAGTVGMFYGESRIYVKYADITSVADIRALLSNNPLQVAYQLATPTTSSVTPTNLPIKSLSGYNHIESSTGDMVVDYITDAYQPIVDLITSSAQVYREVTAQEYEDLPDSKNTDGIMYFVN